MKKFLPMAILLLALPLHAGWDEHGLTLVATVTSSLENAVKYELKDKEGRSFHVNTVKEPEGPAMRRILKQKDEFFAWKNVKIKDLSFFVYEKGVYTVVTPASIGYGETDLKPYLPSGFTFVEEEDTLNYRYRIVVGTTSLKLDGTYSGEEPLLVEMHAYVRGIREGKLTVEDEKVVAGSIVSLKSETGRGEKQIHPVGDINDYDWDRKGGEPAKKAKFSPVISARLCGNYLVPTGDFASAFSGGYGATAGVTLHNTGISMNDRVLFHLDFGFTFGYWMLEKNDSPGADVTRDIESAYIIPLILSARYPVKIWRSLYLAPSLSAGYHYHSLSYNTMVAGVQESTAVTKWIPALAAGIETGYPVWNNRVVILGSLEYMAMFERERNNTAFVMYLGAAYMF